VKEGQRSDKTASQQCLADVTRTINHSNPVATKKLAAQAAVNICHTLTMEG